MRDPALRRSGGACPPAAAGGVSGYKIPVDYYIMFLICAGLVAVALVLDSPSRIAHGLYMINTSRGVLITDYVELAGIGAALVNSAMLVVFNLFLLIIAKYAPTGRVIAALFLTFGFSLFGKNMFNTLPIMMGVWLCGQFPKITKINHTELVVLSMVASTIAPIVSEIAFLNDHAGFTHIVAACCVGVFVGFIFPLITTHVKRMHNNFCLYNGGIAGGFIATMFAGMMRSADIEIVPEAYWNTTYTAHLAVTACAIAAALIVYGFIADRRKHAFGRFIKLSSESDPDDCDYFVKYGNVCYINIGVMCIVSTATMLFMGIPINGPVLGGIFTVTGFAAAGKHIRNTAPILIGSIAATHFNYIEATAPVNILAVLFSTGLAPIAGKYGWGWGIIAGFVHVLIAVFIGDINGGLNLYNNGFAASFVAVLILPVIVFFTGVWASFFPKRR